MSKYYYRYFYSLHAAKVAAKGLESIGWTVKIVNRGKNYRLMLR